MVKKGFIDSIMNKMEKELGASATNDEIAEFVTNELMKNLTVRVRTTNFEEKKEVSYIDKIKNKIGFYFQKYKQKRKCNISNMEDFFKIKVTKTRTFEIKDNDDYTTYAGFYGSVITSKNNKGAIVFNSGWYPTQNEGICNNSYKNGEFAFFYNNKLLVKREYTPFFRILRSFVSCSGIFGVCFRIEKEECSNILMLYNYQLNKTFAFPIQANFNFIDFSNTDKYLLIKTYYSKTNPTHSNKIILIDTHNGNIHFNTEIDLHFTNADINEESKTISLKNDNKETLYSLKFDKDNTEKVLFDNMNTEGKIYHLEKQNTKEELLKNRLYAELLEETLLSEINPYTHRKLGEYYDHNNNIEKALYHYEIALSIIPQIGVKRRYNLLRKKI